MGIIFKTSPRTITILEVYCGFKVHLSYYKRYLSSNKSLKKSRLERDSNCDSCAVLDQLSYQAHW